MLSRPNFKTIGWIIIYALLGAVSVAKYPLASPILMIGFSIAMLLGFRFLWDRVGRLVTDWVVREVVVLRKIGYKVVGLSETHAKKVKSLSDAVELSRVIILMNFIAVLLITKFLGTSGEEAFATTQQLIIALVLAVVVSLVVSPIGISIYIVENSRYRILDAKKALIEYPGKSLRRILRGIFGYGNLIVLLWVFLDSLKTANWDIFSGTVLFLQLVLFVLGTISIGSLIASLVSVKFWSDRIEKIIENLDTELDRHSVSSEEAINILKEILGIIPETSQQEQTSQEEKTES
ncbi:MAG: hypothetical protein ACTSX9_05185 [Candidatus Njordarchaeales archaeon]